MAEEKSQSTDDEQRLHAVIAEYMKRRDGGQKVDQQSLLKAHPDLADGLRSYFQGEAILEDPALAITRLGQLPVPPSVGRDTIVPGHAAADTASEFTARTFGRYQLLRPLGEGAMGSVYLAQDTTLDRRVALKMPRKAASEKAKDSAEFLQRFTREARAAAGLKHACICSVYDAGEIEGTAYITMDYIDGVPLSRLIGTKLLRAVSDILKVVRTIADAVAHAHEKGIIHRDLKPGNILVDNQMNPFVTDFGLARREASADGSRITQEGLLIGTPAYMAPEQVRGEQARVGVTSDIYSLGVILFELLTTRLPFEGSVPDMLAKVLRDAPPIPSRLRKDLTEDIDDVVLKMLQKEPERRYRTMKEVIEAIDRLADKLKTSALGETVRVSQGTEAHARSPFEIRKAHIEQMLKKGQYASAIRDLEALVEEQSPAAKAVVEWARKTLPNAKKEAKALSPSGLKAMLKTAEQLFEKSDYQGCIQLLEDVPSLKRSEEMEVLLQKSQQREVAAEELMEQIRDKERRENPEGLDVLVKKYLKLKPGNAYAKKLWTALQTYSTVPASRRRYRFERGRLQPMPEISLFRRYALLAVLVGVLAFLATYSYVIIYLKSGSQTLAVHVDDEWLKAQGGQLTLVVDGDEHTISTSPANGEPLTIVVKVGDREFSVKHGDAVVHNPRTFTIEREGKSILQITPTDMELRNSPMIASGQSDDTPGNDSQTAGESRSTARAQIRPLTELNSVGLDISAWVSSDGLRIYWEHHDSAGSEGAIFQAERKSSTAPFENKREVLKGHQPTLTDDELEIVYVQSGTSGPKTLMKAARASRGDVFSDAKELDLGEPYALCNSPSVSADGLSLTVNLKSTMDNESTRYVELRRISRSAQWGGAEELKIQWNAEQQGSPLTWITMAADGLSFLATHEQDQGGFRILRFQRSAVNQPFERYEYLSLPGLSEVYGRTPRYIPATKELFLTAPASYPTSRDANVWRNNYQGRLWVVQNADLNATSQDSRLSQAGSETGAWVDLFDGQDTSRWQTLGLFEVEDGLLTGRKGKTMAVSRDLFSDFELEAEWRFTDPSSNGGIFYRESRETDTDTLGWEYQIVGSAHRNAEAALSRTGALFGVIATKDGVEKSVGEWNTARIVCKGPKVEHWLNGQLLFEYDVESEAWRSMVAQVKGQRNRDRFSAFRQGHILLQSYSGDLAFRRIRIREFSKAGDDRGQSRVTTPPEAVPENLVSNGENWSVIQGATLEGFMAWKDTLAPKLYPHRITLRAGSGEQIFDAIAEPNPDNAEWIVKVSDGPDDWGKDVEGYRPVTVVPFRDGTTVRRLCVGTKAHPFWSCWYGSREVIDEKIQEGMREHSDVPDYLCSYRWFKDGECFLVRIRSDRNTVEWHTDLSEDSLGELLQSSRDRKMRPLMIDHHHGNSENDLYAVLVNDQTGDWAVSLRISGAHLARLIPAVEALGARAWFMASTASSGEVVYRVIWRGIDPEVLKVAEEETRNGALPAVGLSLPPSPSADGQMELADAISGSTATVATAPFDAATAAAQTKLWASKINEPEEIEEAGIKLKLIPPGEFTMGSPDSEPNRESAEGPQHRVRITQPFFMGVTEITQKQWVDVMGTRPWQGMTNVKEGDRFPATFVDWNSAKEFCRKISLLTGNSYRLPTEAEWEYACRAGTESRWYSGDDTTDLNSCGWFESNTLSVNEIYAHEVAAKTANRFGLFDMHGNLFEWCEDYYDPVAYARRSGTTEDPVTLSDVDGLDRHVTRGGGFVWGHDSGRSASRTLIQSVFASERDGFRVVRLCKSSPEVVRAEEPANAPFPALKARAYQQAWADHLKLPVNFTNSLGMKFRLIPPGSFTIGSTQEQIDAAKPHLYIGEDPARPDRLLSEMPQQRITLTRPFYLGVTEITQAQYTAVVGKNPSLYAETEKRKEPVTGQDRSHAPVEMVTWVDTGKFCSYLSLHEGLESAYRVTPELITQTGFGGYRLPTEAEWEFACRAGTTTLFWSGDDNQSLANVAWFGLNNEIHMPKPVAAKLANPFGLYDMHGNVWEWTHDIWKSDTYQGLIGPAAVDPRNDTGPEDRRIIRGGDHYMSSSELRSACRDGYFSNSYWDDVGFRVAISIEGVRFRLSQNP